MARTKVKVSAGTTNAATEEPDSEETESTEIEETSAGPVDDDEVLTPLPVKVEPKSPSKKPRRNLGGIYKTKNQIRFNNEYQPTGTVLTFTDVEARHYLKFNAVEAVEDDED
jgi:hypothetical protein